MLGGDLPFIVVLAMDRMKVAAGVAVRHKDLLGFLPVRRREEKSEREQELRSAGIAYGYEFVEKFVAPFLYWKLSWIALLRASNPSRKVVRPLR